MKPMALSCISQNIISSEINELQEGISRISQMCDAKDNGVRCQRPATVNHIVNAAGWASESRYYPPEERHLCDEHFRRVQRLALFIAGMERLQMEGDVA